MDLFTYIQKVNNKKKADLMSAFTYMKNNNKIVI